MAQQRLQFGDQSTADVKLQLIGKDGAEFEVNPLYLHFQILKKSEFFETLLSERWCSEKPPIEIKITTTHSASIYIKCIQLMYSSYMGKRLCFSHVGEALALLPVASELLFHECLEECMGYLNAARWSTTEEVKLRALLLSLEINISPDLAARLGIKPPRNWDLQMLEKSVQKMLSSISNGSYTHGEYIEAYIVAHFETNSSFAEICRYALLEEFSANVKCVKTHQPHFVVNVFAALLWIVNVIQRCDGELFEIVLKMFCEDGELNEKCRYVVSYALSTCYRNSLGPLFDLLDRFLIALGSSLVITSTLLRFSFLTNWIPIFIQLDRQLELGRQLENRLIYVAETLPLVEQRHIYKNWVQTVGTTSVILRSASRTMQGWGQKVEDWGQKVEEAIVRHHNFFDITDSMH